MFVILSLYLFTKFQPRYHCVTCVNEDREYMNDFIILRIGRTRHLFICHVDNRSFFL